MGTRRGRTGRNAHWREIEDLKARLAEAEETLRAIREGEVDAVVVSGSKGEQVFSLVGAESIYRLIVETMKEAAFTASFDGTILYCNAQLSEFVKTPMLQILGHKLDEFIASESKAATNSLLSEVRERPARTRLMFKASDESFIPAHVSANVLRQADELSICVVATDLTELENSTELIQRLRKQQEELIRSESEFRALFESSPDAVFIATSGGVIAAANPAACDMFGMSESELRRVGYQAINDPGDPRGSTAFQELAKTGRLIKRESTFIRKGGERLTAEVDAVVMPNNRDCVFVILRDITERKRAEEELQRSRAELELHVKERTRELSQTVRTLNHESAQRLFAEQFLSKRSEQLHRMTVELALTEHRERQRLAQVLHDGLQQTLVGAKYRVALAARNRELRPAMDQIAKLLDDAISTSRSLSVELSPPILLKGDLPATLEWLARWMKEKHDLDATLTSCDRIPPLSQGMLLMLFQAARELLFNVVKHAGVRTARIELDLRPDQILMTVVDEGVGFDMTLLDAVEGNPRGIGLFGVRERLSYIGGSMEIESAPGKGSLFRLIVPIAATVAEYIAEPAATIKRPPFSRPAPATEPAGAGERIRIMLVDDHLVVREGLAGLLRCEPDIEIVGEASNGRAAVELAGRVRPEVILMDISMPVMDGVQATKMIHHEFPGIRIIGLSTFQEEEQRNAMRDAGAADYLLKSGPSEALVVAIRSCAAAQRQSDAGR